MITSFVDRHMLAELVALKGCPDCLGDAVLVADRLDVNGVAQGVRVAVVAARP
jgi:hypothetical protein